MIDIEEIRPAEIAAYLKLYVTDGRHWSTPRGLLNLVLLTSCLVGSWTMHKVLFGLFDCEGWLSSAVGGFLFMKCSFVLLYCINVTRSQYSVGLCVGATAVWAVHWLPVSQKCPIEQLGDLATVNALSAALAVLQAVLFALLVRHADYISSEHSTYMNLPTAHIVELEDHLSFEARHPMQAAGDYGLSATFGCGDEPPVRLPPGAGAGQGKPPPM